MFWHSEIASSGTDEEVLCCAQENSDSPSGTLRTPNSSSSRNSSKMNTIAGSAKVTHPVYQKYFLQNIDCTFSSIFLFNLIILCQVRTSVTDDQPSTLHSRHQTTKLPQIPNTIA